MRRTQIYIPNELHQKLTEEAKRKDVTVSELIRQRIKRSFPLALRRSNTQQMLKGLISIGESLSWKGTPKDLSTKIDRALYG